MIQLTLIGIGSGSPGHLTREAMAAMNRADVILIPDKGADKADLAELRRALCAEVLTGDTRLVEFAMPLRDAKDGYAAGVERWHDAIAAQWEQAITQHKAQRPALLVWGDPSLYDSTLRIAQRIGQRLPIALSVIPGITAIQALCAAHAIPLNALAAPVLVTTGRQLRDHGWPDCADRIVVMLDGECAFQGLKPQGVRIWWGAYLGMPNQLLDHGPLAQAAPRIIARRAKARADHGWIMDIYLMQRDPA